MICRNCGKPIDEGYPANTGYRTGYRHIQNGWIWCDRTRAEPYTEEDIERDRNALGRQDRAMD